MSGPTDEAWGIGGRHVVKDSAAPARLSATALCLVGVLRYLSCMRFALVLVLATPAHAWDFTPGTPCLLTHESAQAQIMLTHDPAQPLYTIAITRPEPWGDVPVFQMRFDGRQGRMIGTDRHRLSADGLTLTVTDSGFGNVLDGLQFNETAHAIAGDDIISVPLDGAAEPVAAFRACAPDVPIS